VQVGGGNRVAGAAGNGVTKVIRTLAALALLSASTPIIAASTTSADTALSSTAAWWEKVTVTIDGAGETQSCLYESSVRSDTKACDVADSADAKSVKSSGSKGEFTRITFERRFHPGAGLPNADALQPGDKLLGGQLMALAIDAKGAVAGCKVVAKSGDMTTDYGCNEAKAERFEASAAKGAIAPRQGYMTILVYGHAEHVV
jgi:hypothetical protein